MAKFANLCPHCGRHLILKESEHGEFLACPRFPTCRYTESLHGIKELKIYKPPSPYCEKCNHTGLVPFTKEGQVIPFAYLNCTCRLEPIEHYEPLKPEDFDYPCSAAFRATSFEYCNQHDVACSPPVPDITAIENRLNDLEAETARAGGIPRRYTEELQQVKGLVAHLQNNLEEHTDPKEKRVSKRVKQEYGDISV